MKNIVIIGTYPNEEYKVDMLENCIQSLKPLGYDIMVASHYPIPEKIQTLVNYVIYDSENSLITSNIPNSFVENGVFRIHKEGESGHILSVTKNIDNSLKFVLQKKYDFFYYLESDNIFHKDDLLKFELLRNNMNLNKKNMIFFHNKEDDISKYETIIFGGSVDYFNKNIHVPLTVCELEDEHVSLERFIYKKNKNNNANFLIIENECKSFFDKSQINLEFQKIWGGLFGSNSYPHLFLFIRNLSGAPITVKLNDLEEKEYGKDVWTYFPVHNKTDDLNVKITCDNSTIVWDFKMGETPEINFSKSGFIYFK